MKLLQQRGTDPFTLAIGCGGLATRTIERAKAKGLIEAIAAKDTADAAKEAVARVKEGDAVLVKGSRGVAAERVVEALVTWPDNAESATARTS